MQPALIRTIDHLRTTLEKSEWSGNYETYQVWPERATPEQQAEVQRLYEAMEVADDAELDEIDRQLEMLPQPVTVYLLHLTKAEQTRTINLWELCYAIALREYTPHLERVEFTDLDLDVVCSDEALFDAEGDIDWGRLDQKAAQVVQSAFAALESTELD